MPQEVTAPAEAEGTALPPAAKPTVATLAAEVAGLTERLDEFEAFGLPGKPPAATAPDLHGKLVEVQGLVRWIPKRGYNSQQNYAFVRDVDVVDAVRDALVARNVDLAFTSARVIERVEFENKNKVPGTAWVIELGYRFTHWRGGEVETDEGTWVGEAQDFGDKGLSKALTSAKKTFLLARFLVSAGDDPEADPAGDEPRGGAQAETRTFQPMTIRAGHEEDKPTSAHVRMVYARAKDNGITGSDWLHRLVWAITRGKARSVPEVATMASLKLVCDTLDYIGGDREARIAETEARIVAYLEKNPYPAERIDGSDDGTKADPNAPVADDGGAGGEYPS